MGAGVGAAVQKAPQLHRILGERGEEVGVHIHLQLSLHLGTFAAFPSLRLRIYELQPRENTS